MGGENPCQWMTIQVTVWTATFQHCAVWRSQTCQHSHSLTPMTLAPSSPDPWLQARSSQPLFFNPFYFFFALASFTPDLWTHKPRSSLSLPSPLPPEGRINSPVMNSHRCDQGCKDHSMGQWERTVSSTNYAGETGYSCAKERSWSLTLQNIQKLTQNGSKTCTEELNI